MVDGPAGHLQRRKMALFSWPFGCGDLRTGSGFWWLARRHSAAFSARNGEVLWTFDTNQQFEAVNGITGSGGSIDSSGPVVAGKFVYATSGYDKFGQKGGNLLLAFNVGD